MNRIFTTLCLLLSFPVWLSAQGAALCVPQYGVTPTMDALRDDSYRQVLENPYAAPVAGGSTSASDFTPESSARYVYYGAPTFNWSSCENIQTSQYGHADIQNFWMTWNETYLYLIVEGANAFHPDSDGNGSTADRMDLFIAIDVDDARGAGQKLAAAQAPFNKRVDFNGWAPEYFVSIERFGGAGTYGELRAAGGATAIAIDNNAGAEQSCANFDMRGAWNNNDGGVTEVRIPWAMIGGAPNPFTGKPMNFAIYTTFDEDNYDTFDSAPGTGQSPTGGGFEELGDMPFDADYCGASVDPVTGVVDPNCNWGESDNHSGNGNDSGWGDCRGGGAGSDSGAGDFDTVEEYYRITNTGQLSSSIAISAVDASQGCNISLPAGQTYTGVLSGYTATDGPTIIETDGGNCYDPNITVNFADVSSGNIFEANSECATGCEGLTQYVDRTYSVVHQNRLTTPLTACVTPVTANQTQTALKRFTRTPVDGTNPPCNFALPLTLKDFTGSLKNNKVQLTWTTLSETNTAQFKIERSQEQTQWITIGTVTAAQNATTAKTYTYLDSKPLKGNSYYRLKMEDTDGTFRYSNSIAMKVNIAKSLTLFPNPATNNMALYVVEAPAQEVLINIYNMAGQLVASKTDSLVNKDQIINVDINILPQGTYAVRLVQLDGTLIDQATFVKQ